MRFFLFCCIILLAAPAMAQNNPPVFVKGSLQTLTICENTPVTPIDSQMAIFDADMGQGEIWTVITAPPNGALGGFPGTATSANDTITLTGLTYVPTTGFSGQDTFVIQISDGIDSTLDTIAVTVKPFPDLTSSLTPDPVCDGSVFNYTPTSTWAGAAFDWTRGLVSGITNPAATGSGNPFEILNNATFYDVAATYVFSVTGNGCTNVQNVVVTVHPTPRLSSVLADTVCSGALFSYTPTSITVGTTYTWERDAVAGISPGTTLGVGGISEVLTNSTSAPINVIYAFALQANGCTSPRNVVVTVDPQPVVSSITTKPSASLCSGTLYQNFGAGIAPPAGITYAWSAANASIYAVGSSRQYCLVNFPTPGKAVVTLTFSNSATGCAGKDTFAVNVGFGISATGNVYYYDGQFIYTDNTADSYQWGYDNASTLSPAAITGATFQSYPTSSPDFVHNYYWVIVGKNGCTQKNYFNTPAAVANINTGNPLSLNVFPNPAGSTVKLTTDGRNGDACDIVVTNMVGQALITQHIAGNSAELDIAGLPAGCYIVNCLQDGMKAATARLIKN